MNRISTSMMTTSARSDILRAQRSLLEAQQQVASQRKADDLKGYGTETQSIVSSKRLIARSEAFAATAKEAQTRLQIQDQSLGRASDTIGELRQKIIEGMALGEVTNLMGEVRQAFDTIRSSLNIQLGGRYLFGGAVDTTPPVTATAPEDLIGVPAADAFAPDLRPAYVQVDDVTTLEAGPLATTAATVMDAFKALAELNAPPNAPLTGRPTQAQSTALQGILQTLGTAGDEMLRAQGANGVALKSAEDAEIRQSTYADTLTGIVAGKTDVDLTEAVVSLTQAQQQFQASAEAFRSLQGMSLLDLLR
jgi:flagellar hook-associated protein 3 FlgL